MTDNQEENKQDRGLWYQVCLNLAIVAGVLMIGALFVLARDWSPTMTASTIDSEVIESLRKELADHPDNMALRERVRSYDRELREVFFTQQQRAKRAGIFLVFCGGILALTMKYVIDQNTALPMPQGKHDSTRYGFKNAMAGHAFVLVAVSVVVFMAVRPNPAPTLPGAESTVSSAPGDDTISQEEQPVAKLTQVVWPDKEQFKKNWYRFRGPGGSGISPWDNVPLTWNIESGENILWKLPIEMPGNNSPVIWENLLFFSCADETQRIVYAVDCVKGDYLWQTAIVVPGGPEEAPEVMEETGFAAPTCATDDQRVYAMFANGDVAAVGHDGAIVWAKNLGIPESTYGHSASLELYQGLLLIQFDQGYEDEEKSKVFALDVLTGKVIWSHTRPVANQWSSPIVAHTGGRDQFITISNPWAIAYEPLKGEVLWQSKCLAGDVAPSPVCANDLVYLITPYEAVRAYKTDGQGDVTETKLAWEGMDNIGDTCSPLTNGVYLYLLYGMDLVCYKADNGEVLWTHSFDNEYTSSPSLVGDKLLLMDIEGEVAMVKVGDEFALDHTGHLGEPVFTCPAFADGKIFVRCDKQIIAIGVK